MPILPVGFDYKNKKVIFFPLFEPTASLSADFKKLEGYFYGIEGKILKNRTTKQINCLRFRCCGTRFARRHLPQFFRVVFLLLPIVRSQFFLGVGNAVKA